MMIADNEILLGWFTDLLHDFWAVIPEEGVVLSSGRLNVVFEDTEHIRHHGYLGRYQLSIHAVVELATKGEVNKLPGPTAQLIDITYDKKSILFSFVHPYQITCSVDRLRVELIQLHSFTDLL